MTTTTGDWLRIVAYGGGVQSTCLLVLAAQRRINFPVFVFVNLGEDSEHPSTLDYLRRHAMRYAAAHGMGHVELHRTRRNGRTECTQDGDR
jgi:3'-phosphoadenosine 5'-phosphosulfate sulfotransferase (PAPS reductase)/FAD synthetase